MGGLKAGFTAWLTENNILKPKHAPAEGDNKMPVQRPLVPISEDQFGEVSTGVRALLVPKSPVYCTGDKIKLVELIKDKPTGRGIFATVSGTLVDSNNYHRCLFLADVFEDDED